MNLASCRPFMSVFLFFCLSLQALGQSPASSEELSARIRNGILQPETLFEEDSGDLFYSLGADVQSIQRENLSAYWDAFDHLRLQNPHPYFDENLFQFEDFVSKANRTRYPFLSVNSNGQASLLSGKEVNVFSGIEAIGAIQTNRPPGYIREDFHTADGLDLPKWLVYYLVFAKKAPKRLAKVLEKMGYDENDYFVIYMMPQSYDWAVGERLPLLPFILPRAIFRANGYEPEQLDFSKARVVFPQDSILRFEKSGDFRDLASAGIHIPLKDSDGKEFFLPLSVLDKVYKSLHSIFLMSVGLSNPQNFEELTNQVEALSEDLAAQNFLNFQQSEEFGSLLSTLMTEAIIHPSDLPEDRARNRQASTRGPFSRSLRAGMRESEKSEIVAMASKTVGGFANLIQGTKKLLGREKEKSLERDREEIRLLLEQYISAQKEALASVKKEGFSIQEAEDWTSLSRDSQVATDNDPRVKKKKWRQRLILGSICALPAAYVANKLLPVLASEWQSILPYAGLGSIFASATISGFVFYSYLRNTAIRDARAEGLLYETNDPRTMSLLENIESNDHTNHIRSERDRLERAIEHRSAEPTSANPVIAAWQSGSRMVKNFGDRIKHVSISGWYSFRSLESRAETLREQPAGSTEKTALELLGNVMARAYGSVFLTPWHRHAVSLAFPFYFETRERGGAASLRTLDDRGLWPSPVYLGLRAATYGLGFFYPGFKPDRFWEIQDEVRNESIAINSLIEPAISRAVRQLEIAKALELGMDVRLIPSILSVERHLHQEGLSWLKALQNRLPEEFRLSDESLIELVAYSDEVLRLSKREYFFRKMQVKAGRLPESYTRSQKREELSHYAKEQILSEQKYLRQALDEDGAYYRRWSHRLRAKWARFQTNRHETFFRLGKTGENLTQAKALLNLGSYPYTHLQDRLIITAQVVPMIASQSLHEGMTEAELFNGLAPIFLFLGPDNLANYGSGLAVSSSMIDQLLDQRLRNERFPYFDSIWASLKRAPWKRISLQSAAMLDIRILTAVNSGLLMVGMLYPIDVALAGWASITDGRAFGPQIMGRGAGRMANALAGATINLGFSTGSIPFYRSLMVLRRQAGGIGSNGYQSVYQGNPRESSDRAFFGATQAALNILYGTAAGIGVPALSEQFLDWADVEVGNIDPTSGMIITPEDTNSVSGGLLQQDLIRSCTKSLKAYLAITHP